METTLWIILSLVGASLAIYFGFRIAHKQDVANRVVRTMLFIAATVLAFNAAVGGTIFVLLADPISGSIWIGASIALGVVFSLFAGKVATNT